MIKNPSETKSDLTCEECGEPIKQNQIDNKPIYCEFCGALNSSVYAQNQENSQLEQKKIRFSYSTEELSQEIRNFTYQKIYELLKANFSIVRRLKHQEDLKQSQMLSLAKKLRKALLSLSLPSDSAELLTKTSKKKIENYFEKFQFGLKKKKKNQSNYLPYFIENIKFVFRLINGDYEFSNLAKYNRKAVKKLKEKYGFKINAKTKNSFFYSLTILLCRKIYRIITAQGHVLDLKHIKNELTKRYTLNTAKDITALVLNNDFKRNFSKSYRKLKKDLEIDWVYRESFIDHVCSLIKLVYKLTYNKGYSTKLRGFQKLFAEELKESNFFEDDTNFSPYLKLNLTLILSRIIHYVLDSSLNLTPLQSDPRKLNPSNNLRFANEIMDEILEEKNIKPEFLKKFYNLSLEEFQKEYEKLQAILKSDMLYKENFLSFLQKLINTVYKITHTKTKKSNHSKIELAIIQDLANYNVNRESLKKEKSFFYSEEKDVSNKGSGYNTLDYIEDLRNEVGKLVPKDEKPKGKLSYDKFSLYIGMNERYLRSVKNRLINKGYPSYNPYFKFSNDQLEAFLDSLIKKFGKESIEGCFKVIMKYKNEMNILDYRHQQWQIHNPNLKYDFFKILDNSKSGYYFGLLLADGLIDKERNNIGLFLEKNDIKVIERFREDLQISNKLENRIDKRIVKKSGEFSKQYGVRVGCKPMMDDLKKLGFFKFKSGKALKNGFFTELSNRVKYSILLGFYDGDGEEGATKIISSNKKFLEQIKREFNVRNDVRLHHKGKKHQFVVYMYSKTKNTWYLSLGADVFNKMMESYEYSMERKREYYPMTTYKYAYVKLKEKIKDKENLERLLLIGPRAKLAEVLGVSFQTFKKLCDEWSVGVLPRSYWMTLEGKNWKHEFNDKFRTFKDKYLGDLT